jgi:hypothetical protein
MIWMAQYPNNRLATIILLFKWNYVLPWKLIALFGYVTA